MCGRPCGGVRLCTMIIGLVVGELEVDFDLVMVVL